MKLAKLLEDEEFDTYCHSYNFIVPQESGKFDICLYYATTCTDYLTDWLMYPTECPLDYKHQFTESNTYLLVSFPESKQADVDALS